MREKLVVLWLLALLVILNGLILQKESVLEGGRRVLLDIRPRDPRSLMQGDYMILRYRFDATIPEAMRQGRPPTGTLIAELDEHDVARFARFDDGGALAPDEVRLRYQPSERSRGELRVAPESFFFQEGHASRYQDAGFVELRVDEEGDVVIVGLLDRERRPLGQD